MGFAILFWVYEIMEKKKRHRHRWSSRIAAICCGLFLVGAVTTGAGSCLESELRPVWNRLTGQVEEVTYQQPMVAQAQETMAPTPEQPSPEPTPEATQDPTQDIYSFLQGPRSWSEKRPWSGSWAHKMLGGRSFGGFGCGFCCMANIYDSLTPYKASPVQTYTFARKNTYYGGGQALSWGYMRQSLSKMGFDCQAQRKPKSYAKFRRQIRKAQCATVLVSSANSRRYWKNTAGHYVSIFLYDEDTQKVFLADSGDPDHNRSWVSLRVIYDSLKTSSDWQYLLISDYDQSRDTFRHKKASGNWIRPDSSADET